MSADNDSFINPVSLGIDLSPILEKLPTFDKVYDYSKVELKKDKNSNQETPAINEVSEEDIKAEKEVKEVIEMAWLEEKVNEMVQEHLKKIKLDKPVKAWVLYSKKGCYIKSQSGKVVNVYIFVKTISEIWDKTTWKMIKDILSDVKKNKLHQDESLALMPMSKELIYKTEFYKKHHKGKLFIDKNGHEAVFELLPDYRFNVEKQITVKYTDKKTGISHTVTMDFDNYEQAHYEAKIQVSRKVAILEDKNEDE